VKAAAAVPPLAAVPASALPPTQSDRSSGSRSPNTPPDTSPDVPSARPGVFSWLSRMPAPTSQAFTHQVGAQPLLSPNFHNINFTDGVCLPWPCDQSTGQAGQDKEHDMTYHEASNTVLLLYNDLHDML